MISYIEAIDKIFTSLPPLKTQILTTKDCIDYYLAEDIKSPMDLPPFTNSAMDGYAVISNDVRGADTNSPVILKLAGQSLAGHPYHGVLHPGTVVYISTGAPIPRGADAIVPVEYSKKQNDRSVAILAKAKTGQHFRYEGEDINKGKIVLRRHTRIKAAHLGLIAAIGLKKITVYRKPVVGFIATGDELIQHFEKNIDPQILKKEGKIYNSNTAIIRALVYECNCEFVDYGIAGDSQNDFIKKMNIRTLPDIFITSAGVSVGEHDIVAETLKSKGFKNIFWRVAVKPGKPLLFGKIKHRLIFGLPGNPVSTAVVFRQFIKPVIYAQAGGKAIFNVLFRAEMEDKIKRSPGRLHFARGFCYYERGWKVKSTGVQASNILKSLAAANCLIWIPPDQELKPGDSVVIQLLEGPQYSLKEFKKAFFEFFD